VLTFSLTAEIFWQGLKAGLVTFGGAFTVIPYLHDAAVDGQGWLTDGEFVDGLAISGVLPALLIIFSTFVGYLAGGLGGALLMTLGIFLPAFVLPIFFHRGLVGIAEKPRIRYQVLPGPEAHELCVYFRKRAKIALGGSLPERAAASWSLSVADRIERGSLPNTFSERRELLCAKSGAGLDFTIWDGTPIPTAALRVEPAGMSGAAASSEPCLRLNETPWKPSVGPACAEHEPDGEPVGDVVGPLAALRKRADCRDAPADDNQSERRDRQRTGDGPGWLGAAGQHGGDDR
jgi:hypothetical protein